MLASWEEAELPPAEFWTKTPRQIFATIKARSIVMMRRHDERAWLAWHVAALTRTKKLPKLHTLLAKKPSKRRQGWQEQMQIMDMWVARQAAVMAKKSKAGT